MCAGVADGGAADVASAPSSSSTALPASEAPASGSTALPSEAHSLPSFAGAAYAAAHSSGSGGGSVASSAAPAASSATVAADVAAAVVEGGGSPRAAAEALVAAARALAAGEAERFATASASSQGSGSRKRSSDDLSLLCELPPREAEAVGLALEQWSRLRLRVKALEPTLRREGALVQEILDTGLRDENRRTLRKLTQSSAGGDIEETIQQVGKAIGANRERLERILERNHGELVRLSTTAAPPRACAGAATYVEVSDLKEDVLREVDEVLARLKRALAAVRGELLGAKERSDMAAVRRTGRSFNDLKGLVRRLDEERRLITRNSALAALLVTVCRRVLPVRQVDPAALRDIPASCEGYRRIMEFYFFTDAGLYFFGDYPSGPNWFVRLKRNVAILLVRDRGGRVLYNHFAVSGEHRAPGAPLAPDGGPLRSMEAKDEHGRVFNRQHDAEFKLLSGLCQAASSAASADRGQASCRESAAQTAPFPSSWAGATGTLWSRKPLCASCLSAVRQVRTLFPHLDLTVSVGALPSQSPGVQRRPPGGVGDLAAAAMGCATNGQGLALGCRGERDASRAPELC